MFKKARLRIFLNRQPEEACKAILKDNDKFEELFDGLSHSHETDKSGKLLDFFSWLIANKEGIIALIKALLTLA